MLCISVFYRMCYDTLRIRIGLSMHDAMNPHWLRIVAFGTQQTVFKIQTATPRIVVGPISLK